MVSLFPDPVLPPRDPESILARGLAVIDDAYKAGATLMRPLFSGGNDSHCACHIASQHPNFTGEVNFIRTGIGAKENWEFVKSVCREHRWKLVVHKSKATYERFVSKLGFPGPGAHQWVYNWLKDRCVGYMTRGGRFARITGCREQESTRRMGHVERIQVGEYSEKREKWFKTNRIWTAPCFDWSVAEQAAYMEWYDLPRNPIKEKLGISGECFCGAFASPGEIERIRVHAPDVYRKIMRLSRLAQKHGTHSVWGTRPPKEPKGLIVAKTGMMCSGCDQRAAVAGLLFKE